MRKCNLMWPKADLTLICRPLEWDQIGKWLRLFIYMCKSAYKSGVRSRRRSRQKSWQRARSRIRSRSNCLDSDSRTLCLSRWYNLPIQGGLCMHFLGIIYADVVFRFCSYTHIRINRGRGHDLQRRIQGAKHGHAPPPNVRKWHKIDTYLDITRKQCNFYFKRIEG